MDNFEYFNPVRVIFGNGKRHELGQELRDKYSCALMVFIKILFEKTVYLMKLKVSYNQKE
jgi:alcohol dehydrogenase YqhD (iron-dependent ADH family)